MIERIIDISDEPAKLTVWLEQLVIERGENKTTVPLAEVATVVVSNPQVTFSHPALAGIASKGASLIVCDEKHMPVGLLLPIQLHSTQTERIANQANAPLPKRKRLWQQLITAKITAQGRLLSQLHGKDFGLIKMAQSVKSGDPDNIEGQASRIYWQKLFADPAFIRKRDAEDQNRHLNYGYAVLRAIVARAICACGLHPSLGIHHHNRYDAFCLASDLMEPFRPIVDRAVALWVKENDPLAPLDKQAKSAILAPLIARYDLDGESRTLFDIMSRVASSLALVYMGEREKLLLPTLL